MNKSICIIFISFFLFSCFQKPDKELAQEIRILEFERSADSLVFEKYSESESVEIRTLTADAIGKIGNPVHLPILKRLLWDKEPRVIKKSIFALGQINNQDSLLLSLLTNSELKHYQKNIIRAMGRSKNDVILNPFRTP